MRGAATLPLSALCISLAAPALADDDTALITPDPVTIAASEAETGEQPLALIADDQPQRPAAGQGGGKPPSREELEMLQAMANSVFAGDFITLGIGAGLIPSYEGSDNYVLFPGPQIVGQVSGFQFASPGGGPGIVVDLIREKPLSKTNIIAGPLVRVNLNRAIQSQINDPVVEQLGDLDVAIEVGGRFGVGVNGVFSRFDSISFLTDIAFDVAGAHSGTVIRPSINYRRPIGRAAIIRASVAASWVDNDYADFYYGIDAAGSAASGLPVFDAGSGVKSVSANVIGTYDLSGNALDGGWGMFGLFGYSRLREAAAATPITAIRGDANQLRGVVGITYTF
ncbi:MAG: MipA/OmpV family protein [Pseudomonadota bacterium]